MAPCNAWANLFKARSGISELCYSLWNRHPGQMPSSQQWFFYQRKGSTRFFWITTGEILNVLVVRTVSLEIWILSVWCECINPHPTWTSCCLLLALTAPFDFGFLSLEWVTINNNSMCDQWERLVGETIQGEARGLNVCRLRRLLNPALSLAESCKH